MAIDSWTRLEWTRPWGLLALLLPLVLIVLARLLDRPPRVFTGTLAVWREVPRGPARSGARSAWRPPLALWIAALALVCGALALAGPRRREPPPELAVGLLVDTSPSVYLPYVAPDGAIGPGSRLDRALAAALEWLDERGVPPSGRRWTRITAGGTETVPGAEPPVAWRSAPRRAQVAPPWSGWDRAGWVWITDDASGLQVRHAGLVASGGGAVAGPVAVGRADGEDGAAPGRTRIDWDGERLVAVPAGLPPAVVRLEAAGEPCAPVGAVIEAWVAARGLRLVREPVGPVEPEALVIRFVAEGPALEVELGRDGWTASARVAPRALLGARRSPDGAGAFSGAADTWLAARAGDLGAAPVVVVSPGRVELAILALDEPAGDPAAFAVSWAEMLDAVLLPPPEVVALAERRSAGPAARRVTLASAADGAPEEGASAMAAGLALAAALLAALALLLARGRTLRLHGGHTGAGIGATPG